MVGFFSFTMTEMRSFVQAPASELTEMPMPMPTTTQPIATSTSVSGSGRLSGMMRPNSVAYMSTIGPVQNMVNTVPGRMWRRSVSRITSRQSSMMIVVDEP